MRSLLGGKGANVAEMPRIGVPVPDGFTVTTEACVEAMRAAGRGRTGSGREIEERPGRARGAHRPRARRGRAAAAGVGALRRRPLDARDDGHDPQPRHRRRGGRRRWPPSRATRGSPGTPTAASCRCTARSWSASRRRLRARAEAQKSVAASRQDTDLTADDLRGLVASSGGSRRAHGRGAARRPARAAARRGRRGVPLVAQPARRGLPPGQRHPRRPRHRRQRHADGVRQPRRHLGDRRLLHPQPLHRRAKELYGEFLVNAQGEDVVAGIRTPRPLAELEAVLPAGLRAAAATPWRGSSSTTATCRTSSSRSSAARCTCCRRATASAPRRPRCKVAATWSPRA